MNTTRHAAATRLIHAAVVVTLLTGFGPPPPPPSAAEAPATTAAEPTAAEAEPAESSGLTDRDKAAALFLEGTKFYELGQYPDAIDRFQRAWELAPEPTLLYNLGQAHWKWFDVDPDIEHLRRARTFFQNYDKRMRLLEGYNSAEVDGFIRALSAQIQAEEQTKAERERPVLVGPSLDEQEAAERRRYQRERRRRVTKGLNISGITIIALGGASLAIGVAGVITRQTNKVLLDTTSGREGTPSIASAEEDERRRNGYLLGGQMAFGGFIGAAVLLPIGISLRVAGAIREKKDEKAVGNKAVAVSPGNSLLTVEF